MGQTLLIRPGAQPSNVEKILKGAKPAEFANRATDQVRVHN
jgi:hypothetical protein